LVVRGHSVKYWINVHFPIETGKRMVPQDNYLYLREKHRNSITTINNGDKVIIYEVGWKYGDPVESISRNKRRTAVLTEGRKGIRAFVEVVGNFIPTAPYIYGQSGNPADPDDLTRYIGWFKTRRIIKNHNVVKLDDIKTAWYRQFRKQFSSRINGGLKELSAREWNLLFKLLG
jgi:hypothetical protein